MTFQSAEISACGEYRYELRRVWDDTIPVCAFVLLNPSRADAVRDDPTVRKCMKFAKRWGGFGGVVILNLFALRSTDPIAMRKHPYPVGPDNDIYLTKWAPTVPLIVCAWGAHGGHLGRSQIVRRRFADFDMPRGTVWCFRLTAAGEPAHPLYQRDDTQLIPFPLTEAS